MKWWIVASLIWTTCIHAEEKSWQAKMSELSQALGDAIPFLYPDPTRDVKSLNEKITRIYELSQKLDIGYDHIQKVKDADPALPYLAGQMKQDIERAYLSVQDGHAEYAKAVIRSSTAYCVACHTRTKSGTEFPLMKAFAEPLKKASWITKIEFLAASRQFDAVMSEVMGKLSQPLTPGLSALDLERATRMALSIAVRVKKSPTKASFLAEAVTKSSSATVAMKQSAEVWKKDIAAWQKDRSKFESDEDLLKAARTLVEPATSQDPLGGHAEVKYLRATVLMHELLKTYPKSVNIAEALYIIGVSYRALQDLGLWSLQDMYFMACIDQAPHTKLSQTCYKEYESSVTLGYSGSSGIHIPKAVRTHLDKLKEKAKAL